jgi:hypothetical protein
MSGEDALGSALELAFEKMFNDRKDFLADINEVRVLRRWRERQAEIEKKGTSSNQVRNFILKQIQIEFMDRAPSQLVMASINQIERSGRGRMNASFDIESVPLTVNQTDIDFEITVSPPGITHSVKISFRIDVTMKAENVQIRTDTAIEKKEISVAKMYLRIAVYMDSAMILGSRRIKIYEFDFTFPSNLKLRL